MFVWSFYKILEYLFLKLSLFEFIFFQALKHFCNFYNFFLLVSLDSLKHLIRSWTERYPDAKVDPVNVWDDIITSR